MLPRNLVRLGCVRFISLILAFSASGALPGQTTLSPETQTTPQIPAQITAKIDDAQRTTLVGNVHPAATQANDRGAVAPSLPMTDLVLVLRRSPQQQAAFDAFVAGQYDPTSPEYHQWLAPAEVGQRFGPAQADIATVSQWLSSHGLRVDSVSKDRMTLRFSGSAAQVDAAFHTSIHRLSVNGVPHIANMTDPSIPTAITPVVVGVKSLHDFFPRPQHHLGGKAVFNPHTGHWMHQTPALISAAQPDVQASPQFGITVGSGSSSFQIEDVAPFDFATIYNVLPLWSNNIDGTGQTIAIAGTSDINPADVATFRSVFGLPAGTPPQTIVANGVDPGACVGTSGNCTIDDQIENSLDVEWSGAVAKGAKIVLVVAGQASTTTDTLFTAIQYIVDNRTAPIMNVSYGACEFDLGTAYNSALNSEWETASTEGISVFVAAGDSGSASCDQGLATSLPYGALFGTTVSGFASTPYNTAVGGTDLNWGTTASPYWSTSNNSTTGASALNYMPEVPWNDTCTNPLILNALQGYATQLQKAGNTVTSPTDAESACNFVNQWYKTILNDTNQQVDLSFLVDTVGGSGGASSCTTSNGQTLTSCSGGYAKPSWQAGVTGIPSDGKRDLPDVSFFASNGFLGSAYLICVSANGSCVSSTSQSTEPIGEEVGGTSVASPAMAGVMALINQKTGSPQGLANAELYRLGAKQTYSACRTEGLTTSTSCYFNDIDTGTNAMPCSAGSPDCTVKTSGDTYGVLSGYSATTGFDNATGLGSLNVANVVNAWVSPLGTGTATLTLTPSASSIQLGQGVTIQVAVTGSGTAPSGTVSLSGPGITAQAQPLASGGFTFTVAAGALPAGADTLTVSYSGDSNYALATQTVTINVTKLTPTLTLTPSSTTITGNQQLVLTGAVADSSSGSIPAPTGTLSFSGGGVVFQACTLVSGSCKPTYTGTLANGTDTITASYSGDSNYNAATASVQITVSVLTPTVTVKVLSTSLTTTTAAQVQVTVTGSGATPTGTITLTDGPGSSLMKLTGTLASGTYTFNAPAGFFVGGSSSLNAQYSGDSVYAAATSSASVQVALSNPTMTISPAQTSIAANSSLAITVTVASSAGNAPTGGVTVTAGSFSVGGTLVGGTFTATIPGSTFAAGTQTITANYSGDAYYNALTQSTTVTITPSTATYSLSASSLGTINAGSSGSATITVSSSNNYTGSVTLGCALTASPSGATTLPTCSASTTPITLSSTSTSGTGTVTISTTTTTTASLRQPGSPLQRGPSRILLGGVALGFLALFGVPARRRAWRQLFGCLLLLATLVGGVASCGGGSSSSGSGGGGGGGGGVTAGSYTFTVTGTGNPAITPAPSTTITVMIN
jgi:hypothetical protein